MKLYSALYEATDPFGGYEIDHAICPKHLKDLNGILVLWGGEDISPKIYGQKANRYTRAKDYLSKRDIQEIALAKKAMKIGMPIVGICRGAQLLCALSGGSLFQHVENHHGSHLIRTFDGHVLRTNSIHHQMMNLDNTDHELLAWTPSKLSAVYVGENNKEVSPPDREPEIAYFPKIKGLAIQGHPEYLTPQNEFVQYCKKLMESKLHGFLQ